MAFSKIILNGDTLMDVTDTTATADTIISPHTAYGANGVKVTGTATGGTTPTYQSKTVNPTAGNQTITADNGYDALSSVTIKGVTTSGLSAANIKYNTTIKVGDADDDDRIGSATGSFTASNTVSSGQTAAAAGQILSGYSAWVNGAEVKGNIATMTLPTATSASATSGYTSKATIGRSTSDQYINIPTGYNSTGAYYKVSAVPNGSVTAPSSISGSSATLSTGTNTITLTKTVSVTPTVTTAGYISSGTAGNANVSLIASVNTRSSSDLTASGDTVTAPAGYYASAATKSVASGSAGTPTATKGTVSNHQVSVTPSVTNTTGYITGGTKTGSAVTVTAAELVSGTLSITSTATQNVTNYASATIDIPFSTITVSSSNPSGGSNGDIWIKTT